MNRDEEILRRRIALLTSLARLTLWFEAVTVAFWPLAALVGAFVALALFGVFGFLGPAIHFPLLIGFVLAAARLGQAGWRNLRPPPPGAALRRLEHDSALSHRPFETLADHPIEAAQAPAGFWQMHQERARAAIRRLRLSPPRPGLAALDPMALRLLVLIAVAVGLAVAGPRSGDRLLAALAPGVSFGSDQAPVEAWIKPPIYTGRSPILLKPGSDEPVSAPAGSAIEVHVTGGSRAPTMTLADQRESFKPIDGGFALAAPLSASGTLSIRRGWSTLARWRIALAPDAPPVVSFVDPPTATASATLKIDYAARDDYGVAGVALRARLAVGEPQVAAEPIDIVLSSGQSGVELRATGFADLTAHPWAGMRVMAKLVATDVANQTGESPELAMTLPERAFTNPAAKAIVGVRKHVILNDAPRKDGANAIAALSARPDLYREDLSVFLALRAAARELIQGRIDDEDATATIEDLLWNAALRIEDGDRPEAEKALRAAEEALEKALKDPNTPPSEIARLTQNLKDAVNRELQAMLENLKRQMANGESPPSGADNDDSQIVDQSDLDQRIDAMKQLAEDGSRDAAQALLDQLKSLLDNLQAGMDDNKAFEEGMKSLQTLKDLAAKQRALENKDGPDAAGEQDALRKSLDDEAEAMSEAMGDVPPTLGSADKAMRDATQLLRKGQKGDARPTQELAAGQLDEAIKSLSQRLSSMARAGLAQKGKGRRDPLGRGDPGIDRKYLPTGRAAQRSREILDELRRRAGEHERPRAELDYLQRLLQY